MGEGFGTIWMTLEYANKTEKEFIKGLGMKVNVAD